MAGHFVISEHAPGHWRSGMAAATSEDAVAAGTDEAGDDEQDECEQHLSLEQLYDADECDDDGDEPQQHGEPPFGRWWRSPRSLHGLPVASEAQTRPGRPRRV